MKKRMSQLELREIILKNAKMLLSEEYKFKGRELSGEVKDKSKKS